MQGNAHQLFKSAASIFTVRRAEIRLVLRVHPPDPHQEYSQEVYRGHFSKTARFWRFCRLFGFRRFFGFRPGRSHVGARVLTILTLCAKKNSALCTDD